MAEMFEVFSVFFVSTLGMVIPIAFTYLVYFLVS